LSKYPGIETHLSTKKKKKEYVSQVEKHYVTNALQFYDVIPMKHCDRERSVLTPVSRVQGNEDYIT
jgi:hypothetical protein